MKKLLIAITALVSLTLVTRIVPSYGAGLVKLPAYIMKDISKMPDKPYFLIGLERKTDEWERYLEERKIFLTQGFSYGSDHQGLMDRSQADYKVPGNTELSETVQVLGKEIKILYSHHHRTKDGMYTFWFRTGEKNLAEFSPVYEKYKTRWALGKISDAEWRAIQSVLGQYQFEAVKSFVHEVIQWAAKKDVKDYAEMHLTSGVLEARSKLLDDPDYAKHLDDAVPGSPDLKVRDILVVPLTRAEDFLPDLIVVGPGKFIGGFANFKTPGTQRIVFLDIRGLALWYAAGWQMPAHEFVHSNPYLQGTPLTFYYDLEMWADLTTGLDSGMMEFLQHPYMALIRYLARTFYGYDFEEVRRKIFHGDFGAQEVSEKDFRENAKRVKKIRDEMIRFVKDPKNGLMVKFYTDPYFWITVNTKLCDTSAAFQILFALQYESAGLFDPDKKDSSGAVVPPAVQTKEWLTKEEEGGRIKRLAEKAMESVGKESKFAKDMSKSENLGGLMKCPVDSRFFLLNAKEKERFVPMARALLERARGGDREAQFIISRVLGLGGLIPYTPR